MKELIETKEQARTLTREQFVKRYPCFFLVKRPRVTLSSNTRPPTFTYATVAAKHDADPFADEWQLFSVTKRPGNPFPERITVGRTPNCDIVLRVPFISKAHAHILAEPDGSMSLRDNQGANGTFHERKRLEAGETRALKVGDSVRFGSLEFEFVDAPRLYEILNRELGK